MEFFLLTASNCKREAKVLQIFLVKNSASFIKRKNQAIFIPHQKYFEPLS